jgi:hypothetical protein
MSIFAPDPTKGLAALMHKPTYGTPPIAPTPGEGMGVGMTPAPQHGLAGFFDRALNPTNALGQFGQALVAGGGGPLGNAMTYMMQQRAEQAHAGDKFGEWKQQYDYENAHPKPASPGAFDAELAANGILPGTPEYAAAHKTHLTNELDPIVSGSTEAGPFFVPRSQMGMIPGAMALPPPQTAPAPSLGQGDKPDWSLLPKGGAGSGQRPFPVSALDQATAQGESGNRDYSGGRPITSPMGAKYAMQVMPGTARAPGFGLAPANPDNPGDMNRLGREYRAKMQQRYGGDLRKMWAAYNWGPGNLDKAIAAHGQNGWFAAAPQETRDYVARNLRNLGAQ